MEPSQNSLRLFDGFGSISRPEKYVGGEGTFVQQHFSRMNTAKTKTPRREPGR